MKSLLDITKPVKIISDKKGYSIECENFVKKQNVLLTRVQICILYEAKITARYTRPTQGRIQVASFVSG